MTLTPTEGAGLRGRRRPRRPAITASTPGTGLPAPACPRAPGGPVPPGPAWRERMGPSDEAAEGAAERAAGPAGAPGTADEEAPKPVERPGTNEPPDATSRRQGGPDADGAPQRSSAPALSIQVNALQALCRQVFGFRLAMIALAAPAALLNASPGLGVRLVGAAVIITFMASYVLFRDWERFAPLLLRHPTLLALDTLVGSLPLISAGPDSTLAYVSVCTPLLAGLVYSWRGAAVFASLQSLILLLVHATLARNPDAGPAETLLLPGLCVITGAAGSTLRNLMLRFGEATHALTTVQARLAVTEAVAAERARLARELHDTVAKTLHGVALAADGLANSAGELDPSLVKDRAELVARSARRAAAESRELLADLRREADPAQGTDILAELAARVADFTARTGVPATCHPVAGTPVPPVPPAVARQLLTIATEAMENAHRHAAPTRVEVTAGVDGDQLLLSVHDDGRGMPPETDLEQLCKAGHFGVVGMVERAASVGARIRIGRGDHPGGTEVRLELPLAALDPTPERRPNDAGR
ncbi:sensor histidine kinase [Streptomyces sp. NPDC052023]|uniref:sensor histidine kinase n=1 Tax=Streptomyces sp. NPDC052023 TaxID=3365681 RepID=UPI0037D8379B